MNRRRTNAAPQKGSITALGNFICILTGAQFDEKCVCFDAPKTFACRRCSYYRSKMILPVVKMQIWKRSKEDVPGTHNDQRPSEEGRGDVLSDEQVFGWCRTSLIQQGIFVGVCALYNSTV